MILFADGLKKIRRNLERVQAGEKFRLEKIGRFTDEELDRINCTRAAKGFPAIESTIVFHGRHMYKSRCLENGYSIEQVVQQAANALSVSSVLDTSHASLVLKNPIPRYDIEDNRINDQAVFKCTARHPFAELFSVIPKGDRRTKEAVEKLKGSLEE